MRVVKKDYFFDLEMRMDSISEMDPRDRPVRPRSLYQEPTDQDARDAAIVMAPAQPWSFDDIDFGADQSFDDIARFLAHLSIQGYDEID